MSPLRLLVIIAVLVGAWKLWPREAAALHPDDPRNATGDDRIVMLAAEWCGYCRKQQKAFELSEVRYRVIDIDTEAGQRAMRALRARGVPTTVVGQDVVYGYDTEGLQQKLEPLGYRDVF
ncbi:glutaredoxin domain-containing protein [Marilutibacter maris]|uniref:Glutaredoxin n=1 Tax=Marilutibacter maris TaxID=1605891 RepID=A0A2U9T9B3_9GAMM|nr:glutaredoxin domain-containing protein [Lysobacter maris]AWV07985.1 glutaredoxin [Lysobacter maris]KAB8170750.1 glutaredoxin family protein [Lysobacter maris]